VYIDIYLAFLTTEARSVGFSSRKR